MKWQERVALLRKAADLITERIFMISAALCHGSGQEPHGSAGGCG